MFEMNCPHCKTKHNCQDSDVGKKAPCTQCGKMITAIKPAKVAAPIIAILVIALTFSVIANIALATYLYEAKKMPSAAEAIEMLIEYGTALKLEQNEMLWEINKTLKGELIAAQTRNLLFANTDLLETTTLEKGPGESEYYLLDMGWSADEVRQLLGDNYILRFAPDDITWWSDGDYCYQWPGWRPYSVIECWFKDNKLVKKESLGIYDRETR